MKPGDAAPVDLHGQRCVVTGANGGIGDSVCEHFLALGALVYATDRGEFTRLDEFTEKYGDAFNYRAFNLLDDRELQNCADWLADCALQVLVNNAAVFDMSPFVDANLDQYDRIFGVNVRAAFVLMQAAARSMVEQGCAGSIINMASQAGHRGEALVAHYCASKAAIISYTQSAALALAPDQIRVNAISPGVIDTPMWAKVDALFAKYENRKLGEKKELVGKEVPLGYMGAPRDVARVAVFLASQQSAYMTAQTINIDGGNVLR